MHTLTPKLRAALQAVADGIVTSCDESQGDDTATFQLLYDAGLITLADASADDGTMFLDMRITILGQTRLRLGFHSGAKAEALRALMQRQETLAAIAESYRYSSGEAADTMGVERRPAVDSNTRSIPATAQPRLFFLRASFWAWLIPVAFALLPAFFTQDEMKGFWGTGTTYITQQVASLRQAITSVIHSNAPQASTVSNR